MKTKEGKVKFPLFCNLTRENTQGSFEFKQKKINEQKSFKNCENKKVLISIRRFGGHGYTTFSRKKRFSNNRNKRKNKGTTFENEH